MDDREIAKILRKRNLAYVKHLNQTSPHSESHDRLEGGFLSAVAAAARIAAKMAIRVAKAGAKAAAKAAKAAAKATKRAASAAAKAAKKAAKNISKSKNLNKLDTAMNIADVGQAAARIAQNLMKKKMDGEEISDEEFGELTAQQQIEIDFQRWARGLERADYELFKARGGDKSAALQLARLMDAGMDPDDWVGKEMNAVIDATTDELEERLEYNAGEDEECEDELDKDDRSQLEINGLIALSLIDQGLGEFISEQQLEKRQQARYNSCVARKNAENQRAIGVLKKKIGIDPDDPDFDIDDIEDNLNIQSFVLGKLAISNPNVAFALELDGPRSMAGLPPVDALGAVFKSPDTILNNNVERMAMWFIENDTLDYSSLPLNSDIKPDQNWIASMIEKTPDFIQRAIARMPYFETFATNEADVNYSKRKLTEDFVPLSPEQQREKAMFDQNEDWIKDLNYQINWTTHYNSNMDPEKPGKMKRDEDSRFYKSRTDINRGIVPDKEARQWDEYPFRYEKKTINKAGVRAVEALQALLEREKEAFDAATEQVLKFDERKIALSAKDPFVPNKAYVVGNLIKYGGKAYRCIEAHTSGEKIDLTKWDELTLYDEEDLAYLENIGAATPYKDYTKYPIGVFVKYSGPPSTTEPPPSTPPPDRIFKKIKDSEAGVKPTEVEYWDEILLKDGDRINILTDPGKKWNAQKGYKKGDKVLYEKDLQTYVCTQDNSGVPPDNNQSINQYWKRLITFDIDEELATRLIKEQRLALFSSVITTAEGYDAAEIYKLRDVVYAFDGKYYELIKEKKNRAGEVIQPPIPPNATYWKVVSKGITVWDPKETYNVNDFVQYTDGENYLCVKDAPAGTLPTDGNFWQPLDEEFELLDDEAIEINRQNYENAVMDRADEYQDDPTASYEVDEIVKIFDEDGYPQFYMCIKDVPFGRASGTNLRKPNEPYNNGKVYPNGKVVSENGILYEMIAQSLGPGFSPGGFPTMWKVLGFEKDPGPPNPEFWKDYSAVDAEEEKYDKLRKTAKTVNIDTTGIKVGDLIIDPMTGMYYKLILNPEGRPPPSGQEYKMTDLPNFDNTKKRNARFNALDQVMWEIQDIPTELEARIANIEKRAIWRNDRLYKRDDLVIDQYKLKYLCVKDTPYAPMEPRWSPDYFIQLSDDDWEEAVLDIKQGLENRDELVRQQAGLEYDESDIYRKYKWDEIVYYKGKFYKFQAQLQDKNNNSEPKMAQQRIPGVIQNNYGPIEWIPCTAYGDRLIIKDTDYPGIDFLNTNGINMLMYTKGGPIIQVKDKYYVYNNSSKEIFGGNPDEFFAVDWWQNQSWGSLQWKQGPEDTMTVEVFADGKPVNKHDLTTGAITDKNIDVSSLPPGQASTVTDAVEEGENDITCPTADDEDDDDTHHERTQAEKDLEKAMIEWVAKGSKPEDNPLLLQGQNPNDNRPITGTGLNIEELDGSKYHKKSKVRKSKKK